MSAWTIHRGALTPAGRELRDAILAGGNDTQIAARLGVGPSLVRKHRRAMGLKNPWCEGKR